MSSKNVERGDFIGKIYPNIGRYESGICSMSLEAPQLHFGWENSACDFVIEGYKFSCGNMKSCPGTYTVPCNNENLNTRFISTNKEELSDDVCRTLFAKKWFLGQSNSETQELQICLRRFNNSEFGYNFNGILSAFDLNQLLIVRNLNKGDFLLSLKNNNLTLEVKSNINVDSQRVWLNSKPNGTKFYYDSGTKTIRWKDKCLDGGTGSLGQELRIYSCHGGENQKWIYDESNRIVNLANKLCIDAQNGLVAGSKLYIHYCHEKENQRWDNNLNIEQTIVNTGKKINFLSNGSLSLNIINGQNDVNNRVNIKTYEGLISQKFVYDSESKRIKWLDKCLDGGTGKVAQEIRIYPCHNDLNQKWILDDKNRIVNQANNLCLDAKNGVINNSFLYIHNCHNEPNQKWKSDLL